MRLEATQKGCSNHHSCIPMENPARKRRRPAVACTECRRRKVKCDRDFPCGPCIQTSLSCVYSSPSSLDPQPGQNMNRQSPTHPLQVSLTPGPNVTAGRFGAPNSNYYLAGPMPDRDPPTSFAHIDSTQLRGYGKTHGERPNMMHHSASSSSGRESECLLTLTAPSLAASANSSLPALPVRNRCSFSRTKSFGSSHWKNIFEQVSLTCFLELLLFLLQA